MTAPAKFADDGTLRAVDPRTWEVLQELRPHPPSAVADAVAAARAAQIGWAKRPLKERCAVLRQVLVRTVERKDALAETIRREHGKSTAEALLSEVMGAASVIDVHLKVDAKWLKPERVPIDPLSYPGKKGRIEHRPKGVIGLITPWNYPLALPMRTIVPALIAGNAVVFKPSEYGVLAGRAIAELFEGLLPDGLLATLIGGGDVGAALSTCPDLDALVFTGSVKTGRAVAKAAAENLVPVSLELGGKDAAIVCNDADVARSAAGIAWGAFHNTGQNCAAIERVYVEDQVYDAFLAALVEETKALRTAGSADLAEVGPLCNEQQFSIVRRQLEEAVAGGATVLCGGEPTGEGFGFQPTVVVDAPADCALWQQETFGPVLPVRRVHSAFEAVDLANDSPYGLSVSVWGKETGRASMVAQRCEVGMALVNNHAFTGSVPTSPWVGRKESGTGVTGSRLAMQFLTRPQLVVVDTSRAKELWWFPLSPPVLDIARTALDALVAPLGRRIMLTLKLLGLLGKRWS
jgi:acyl-CoA reductase-like NAD-dependent aldehyde dehydrogenase